MLLLHRQAFRFWIRSDVLDNTVSADDNDRSRLFGKLTRALRGSLHGLKR